MREVGKEEFFNTVGRLDVHPNSEPNVTYWKLRNGQIVGRSTPGYIPDGTAKRYFKRCDDE